MPHLSSDPCDVACEPLCPSSPQQPPQDAREGTTSGCGDRGAGGVPGTHHLLPSPCRPGGSECGEVAPGDVPVHDGGAQAPGVEPLLPRGGPHLAEQGESRCHGPPSSPPRPEPSQPSARATVVPQGCAEAGRKARRMREVFRCFGSCKSPVGEDVGVWVAGHVPGVPVPPPPVGGTAPGSLPCPVQWGQEGQRSQGDVVAANPR